MVLYQSRVRGRIRCGDHLFLRLGWISLSCVRVFVFDRAASGRCALGSGALHLRFRPGDVQLLRADQSGGFKYGLSQRASRFAVDTVEQSAKATRNGAGVLRQSKVSLVVESHAFTV